MENKFLVTASPHIRDNVSTKKIMRDVIIALAPATLLGIYYFKFSAFLLIAVCVLSCVAFEYLAVKLRKKANSIGDLSAAVTGLLLALSLPPQLPIWMAILGSFLAIVVIKQLYGGIGNNFINPALGARVFLLISFAKEMTAWVTPGPDAVATATPLMAIKQSSSVNQIPIFELFIGNTAGSIGETSILALLLGGIWLLSRTVITWHIPVSYLGTAAAVTWMFGGEELFTGDPLLHLLTGSLVMAAIYMATDYTTTPMTKKGSIIFGVGCGLITAVIRLFGSLPEGVSFAIIFMNILVPLIDRYTIPVSFGGEKKK